MMNLKEKCKVLEFKELGDERGKLVAIESLKEVPFEIKRIFYIYGTTKNTIRGQHANKKSRFVLINLRGSCKVRLYDDDEELVVELSKPNTGLYIPELVWKDMFDFSQDSLLLAISDQYYDKDEYVRTKTQG